MNKIRQTDQIIVILNPIDFFRSLHSLYAGRRLVDIFYSNSMPFSIIPSDFIVQVVFQVHKTAAISIFWSCSDQKESWLGSCYYFSFSNWIVLIRVVPINVRLCQCSSSGHFTPSCVVCKAITPWQGVNAWKIEGRKHDIDTLCSVFLPESWDQP